MWQQECDSLWWSQDLAVGQACWIVQGCDDLSHGTFIFLDFMLHVLWFSFSKSKDQVISHVMDHGTSHVMGQVTCHVMANSCITCTYLVTQLLTEHQVLMTHCQGCHPYLWIHLLFRLPSNYESYHVTPALFMYKRLRSLPWVPILTSCGFGTQVSPSTLMYYIEQCLLVVLALSHWAL
jgi:hypothetical protein